MRMSLVGLWRWIALDTLLQLFGYITLKTGSLLIVLAGHMAMAGY